MRVSIGDVRLFFDVSGAKVVPSGARLRERPTLLVLHGGPGFDHSLFKPWFGALEDTAQVVYLDHRGNGRSDRGPADRLTLAQWGDDVRSLCEVLGIERPVVLGESFGGFVAQAYATRHPDHPGALILSNTAPHYCSERVLAAFERLGGAAARAAAAAFLHDASPDSLSAYARVCLPLYHRTPQDPDQDARALLHANFELSMAFFRGEYHTFDFREALGRVRCPTLVVGGEDDPITPIGDSEAIVAALPRHLARLERFPGCGHPVYHDDPERYFRVVRQFLASLD